MVNNLAEMLSQKGIKNCTFRFDTKKNAYYIYTENEEDLRKIAYGAMANLRRGEPKEFK